MAVDVLKDSIPTDPWLLDLAIGIVGTAVILGFVLYDLAREIIRRMKAKGKRGIS